MKTKKHLASGFSLIELIVVIMIIAILTALVAISYDGVQVRVYDSSVQSDLDVMDTAQTKYGVPGKVYYSGNGNGYDGDLDFTPTDGNVIDVSINDTDYCIRGYSSRGTKKSIYDAFIKESTVGVCDQLVPSAAALADSPALASNVPLTWRQVTTGFEFACGIANNFKAYCWGWNSNGQLGNNSADNEDHTYPVAVYTTGTQMDGKAIKSISAGSDSTCAIDSDDKAYCWGGNGEGELGNNLYPTPSYVPSPVTTTGTAMDGKTFLSISVGEDHACAVASDHQAYCWGADYDHQLGNIPGGESHTAVAVYTGGTLNGKTVKYMSTSSRHTCVIASDDKAYCWGDNGYGGLGNNDDSSSAAPVAVDMSGAISGKTIKSIAVGTYHTCAIASDGQAYCWGWNNYGQLGNNTIPVNSLVPAPIVTAGTPLDGKTILSISASGSSYHTCAIAYDNKVYCWGENSNGAVGDGTQGVGNNKLLPTAVLTSGALSGKTIKYISAGGGNDYTLAIDSDGKAYSWGGDEYGQLGRSWDDNDIPVTITRTLPPSP